MISMHAGHHKNHDRLQTYAEDNISSNCSEFGSMYSSRSIILQKTSSSSIAYSNDRLTDYEDYRDT